VVCEQSLRATPTDFAGRVLQVMHTTLAGNGPIRVHVMAREGMKTPEDICPDFPEWPQRWRGVEDDVPPLAKLLECVDSDGGPLCRHIDSEWALKSFDATCRRLHKFLEINL